MICENTRAKKVLIWGIGADYDKYVNYYMFEEQRGNIDILALISKDNFLSYLDCKKVITKNHIGDFEYDYIIVSTDKYYDEIVNEAVELGVKREKIISGRMFSLPLFDFNSYIDILERRISIISDDCWGAYTYNYLGMKFNSPFILLWLSSDDYIKLLNNLDFYLAEPLKQTCDNSLDSCPVGSLGEGQNKIYLNFNHSICFQDAKNCWERRRNRFNKDDIFVKMTIDSDEHAEQFDKLPYKNKVGFYYKDTDFASIVNLKDWNNYSIRADNNYQFKFNAYVLRASDRSKIQPKPYNIFKMLCGEKDFIRKM